MTQFAKNESTGFSADLKYGGWSENYNIRNMTIKAMIECRVRECPERVFMKSGGSEYEWRDIDRGSSAIAGELYALGVRSGTHVALCGSNSVNWILTFFAIQKIGAVAVLLNPHLTPEEIYHLAKIGDFDHFCLGNASVRDRKQFLAQIIDPENHR